MNKQFKLQNLSVGSTIAWQIVTLSSKKITVDLKSSKRLFFSETVSENTMQIPNAQGADICNDAELTLTFTGNSDLSITTMSYDLLSNTGDNISCAYHYNGYVAGNQKEKLHVIISVWSDNVPSVSSKNFIAECFYKYLKYKNRYLFNYISDNIVKSYTDKLSVLTGEIDYRIWYDTQRASVTSDVADYKLILSILLDYDKRVDGTGGLCYSVYKDLVFVVVKKKWNETKLTIGSCPFQNIRGIVLNETELKRYKTACYKLSKTEMFTKGILNVSACHANSASKLDIKANRGLSFANIGIEVFSKSESEQKKVIDKSIKYASKNAASILIFPELAINENMLTYLESSLKSNDAGLKLVVGGSYYKHETDDVAFKNLSPIYANISGQWQRITDYAKMIPFSMGYSKKAADAYNIDTNKYPLDKYKLLMEDIHMDDNITLLPYKDCVIGVAICRDAMDLLDSHNPLHK